MNEYWLKDSTSLFWMRSEPVYLTGTEIERISWREPEKARVILTGILPLARALLGVEDGAVLELHYKDCGRPDEYYPDEIIMTFRECRVRRHWIPSPLVLDPSRQEDIKIYLSLECKLEI